MKPRTLTNGAVAKRIVFKGKRVVMVEEDEFDRLLRLADEWEPTPPKPNPATGNYPADEAMRASLAIDIIRHRRRLGLTQAELASRASVRLETLQLIESGEPRGFMIRSIDKIDFALTAVEAERSGAKARKKKANATAEK